MPRKSANDIINLLLSAMTELRFATKKGLAKMTGLSYVTIETYMGVIYNLQNITPRINIERNKAGELVYFLMKDANPGEKELKE